MTSTVAKGASAPAESQAAVPVDRAAEESIYVVRSTLGGLSFGLEIESVAGIEEELRPLPNGELPPAIDIARLWGVTVADGTRRRVLRLANQGTSRPPADHPVRVLVGSSVEITAVPRHEVSTLPALIQPLGAQARIRSIYLTPRIGFLLDPGLLAGAAAPGAEQ